MDDEFLAIAGRNDDIVTAVRCLLHNLTEFVRQLFAEYVHLYEMNFVVGYPTATHVYARFHKLFYIR